MKASKASLTPSRASQRSKTSSSNNANPNSKDPLDALTSGLQRPSSLDRRSGLQDVDESYLQNVYAFGKHKRADALKKSEVTADMLPAGVPTRRLYDQNKSNMDRSVAGEQNKAVNGQTEEPKTINPTETHQAKEQFQAAQAQAQAQAQMQNAMQQQQMEQQQQQQNQQQQQQQQKQQQQQQQQLNQQQQQQQENVAQPAAGGDHKLYTCPNCKTTLYLDYGSGDFTPDVHHEIAAKQ